MCIVSVIIVNWNGRHFLQECLDSVLVQKFDDYEVIVVDNGSADDSVEFIRDNYRTVKLVCLTENRGFTGGNLAGYAVAQGRFIALLNNDTRVDTLWLNALADVMQTQKDIGICACRIIIDGTELIDSVGDIMTTAFSGTKVGHGQPSSCFEERAFLHGGCAAAILYRKTMLDQIGFLDDDFFFNHEDTDLNLRAWLAGWKCLYVPEAIVYHKVNASVGVMSDFGVYHFARNTVWVWIKNLPFSFLVRSLPQRVMYELSSFVYFCLVKGKWRPFLRGKYDALRGIGKMWRKRKDILPLVRLRYSDVTDELMPIGKYLLHRLKPTNR